MTTKVKSETKRANSRVSRKNSKELVNATNNAVAGTGTSHERRLAIESCMAAPDPVSVGRASAVANMMDEKEIKVIELRQKIASRWAAPRFEDSKEYSIMSAALAAVPADLRERSLNGARLAWLARPENAEKECTLEDVCTEIKNNYSKEFKALCGCSVPAASAVRLYSYTNLSVSNITPDSNINDFLISSAVPAGLGASGLISVVMSVRILVDIKRRFAAARAAARNDFKSCMASAARRACRLGLSASVASRYFAYLLNAVPAADNKEENRLRKNLASCWATVRTIENNIVLASPAGAFGAIEDLCGGWCFPASLPASAPAPAKVRKLWAKRVRLLSDIDTLNILLARC